MYRYLRNLECCPHIASTHHFIPMWPPYASNSFHTYSDMKKGLFPSRTKNMIWPFCSALFWTCHPEQHKTKCESCTLWMATINLHVPLNGTDSLKGCQFFRSTGLHLYEAHSLLSVNDKTLMNGTVYLMDSQILRRRLFLICSHFFGANSLAKNVSEKQHVFCLQTRIQSEHPNKHAVRGGLILTGFSLADAPLHVSQTKMTTGGVETGGNRVRMAASRIGGRR